MTKLKQFWSAFTEKYVLAFVLAFVLWGHILFASSQLRWVFSWLIG